MLALFGCHKYFSDSEGKNMIEDKQSVFVPALPHDFSENEMTFDENYHWPKFKNCMAVTDKRLHTFEDGNVCSACGMVRGFVFYKGDDDSYQIEFDKTYADKLENLVIPSSFKGLPVKRIADRAFSGCENLKNVRIHDNILSIGVGAFSSCSSLTEVKIPDSVTSIDRSAFSGCDGLKNIALSKNISYIDESVFSFCLGLTEITIPDNITSIGPRTFSGCSALTEVKISDSVTDIGIEAFSKCKALKSITLSKKILPAGLKSVGENAFSGCAKLSNVYFEGTSQLMSSVSFEAGNDNFEAGNDNIVNASHFSYSETLPLENESNFWHYVDGLPVVWTKPEV